MNQSRQQWLAWLASLNRTGVFLGVLVIGLVAMFVPGIAGALLLYAVVIGLAALFRLTWSVTAPPARVVRVLVLGLLVVIATVKLTS